MSDVAATPQTGIAHRDSHPKKWLILFTILAIEIMDILDGTIVNVAIPSIRGDLGASSAALQWIVGGYALSFSVGLITGGRLGDIYGRKRMFMTGIVVFVATSLACGLAPSPEWLIVFRVLQGFGAAVMIPQGFGLVRDAFSAEELPKAFGLWGPMVAFGALAGPIIGGLIIELNAFDTDWRGVFLVNVPLGVAAFVVGGRVVPESGKIAGTQTGLDIPGALLMGAAAGLLIYPLIEGREAGWPVWIFLLGAAGLLVLAAFALYERARERTEKSTLIATSIFKKPSFVSGTVLVTLFFGGFAGLLLVTTLYLQIDQHYSAIHAGLTLVPMSIGAAIGSGLGVGVLLPKIGRTTLHAGLVAMLIAIVLLLIVLSSSGHDISTWDLAGPLVVLGIGLGALISPIFNFVLGGVEDHELGSGSGVLNAMQQFGGATGVAVIGTIFFSVAANKDFLAGYERTLIVLFGTLIVIGALAFLLPLQPREDELG